MALYYNLDTNFSDEIITHFQKEVCEAIKNDIPLKDSNLCVVKVKFYDKDIFLFDSNYLFFLDSIHEYALSLEYNIRNDRDEKKLELIKNLTGALLLSELKNYKFINDIENSMMLYKSHLS